MGDIAEEFINTAVNIFLIFAVGWMLRTINQSIATPDEVGRNVKEGLRNCLACALVLYSTLGLDYKKINSGPTPKNQPRLHPLLTTFHLLRNLSHHHPLHSKPHHPTLSLTAKKSHPSYRQD